MAGFPTEPTSVQVFEIELYKGKPTRKFFQLIITRLDSGFYEVVQYAL